MVGVARFEQGRLRAGADRFQVSPAAGRPHREAGGNRLQDSEAESLIGSGGEKQRCPAVPFGEVVAVSQEAARVSHAEISGQVPQPTLLLASPGELELPTR